MKVYNLRQAHHFNSLFLGLEGKAIQPPILKCIRKKIAFWSERKPPREDHYQMYEEKRWGGEREESRLSADHQHVIRDDYRPPTNVSLPCR